MSDLFSDEDEVANIFDEEEVEEDAETDESTEEDVELASFGLNPKYFKGYHKRYPDKNIFYGKHLTNHAFAWYLGVCSSQELEVIKEDKLTEKQAEILAKQFTTELKKEVDEQEEIEQETEEFTEKEKKTIAGYIEQAKKLRAQIEQQKGNINTILQRSEAYFSHMAFLYEFMSERMEIKAGANVLDEEMERINEIDEVLNT